MKTAISTFQVREAGGELPVLVDFGFEDLDAHRIDELVEDLLALALRKPLIIWNLKSGWDSLDGFVQKWNIGRGAPILLVRSCSDVRLLSHAAASVGRKPQVEEALKALHQQWLDFPRWRNHGSPQVHTPVAMSPDAYISAARKANDWFLRSGFEADRTECGFFRGNIHLLGARCVRTFFSLSLNLDAPPGGSQARWECVSEAMVRSLMSTTKVPPSRLQIIALGLPAARLLPGVVDRLPERIRGGAVNTYDIPNAEEMADIVTENDLVLLLCDVISTGSLVAEVEKLVRKQGGTVIGAVVVADAREKEEPLLRVTGSVASEIELRTGSRLPDESILPVPAGEAEYWVDPVSLVPCRDKTFGIDIGPEFETSLKMLSSSGAVKCGHIIDGTRHMSAYIDLARLMSEQAGNVRAMFTMAVRERLEAVKWKNFFPDIVLHPSSGIYRVQRLPAEGSSATGEPVYHSAVLRYCELIGDMWHDCRRVEVPRAFDPGGNPRCAREFDLRGLDYKEGRDVIVVDDGLWSGRTALALARSAVERLGASRILVAPLVGRITAEEKATWHAWRGIGSADGKRTALVCFAFPLLLPIPAYGLVDCPYERAIAQLQEVSSRTGGLLGVAAEVSRELRGLRPSQIEAQKDKYSEVWVQLRAYAELAGEDEGSLEKLKALMEVAHEEDERAAVMTLFLHEGAILGRPRLRQSIGPVLRQLAMREASEPARSTQSRVLALALLRTHFAEEFLEALTMIPEAEWGSQFFVNRIVLQLASLSEDELRQGTCRRLLAKAAASVHGAIGTSGMADRVEQPAQLYAVIQKLILASKRKSSDPVSVRSATAELGSVLELDFKLVHDTRATLEFLSMCGPDISAKTYREFSEDWENERKRLFEDKVVPLVAQLSEILMVARGGVGSVLPADVEYLIEARMGTPGLLTDMGLVSFALRLLAEKPGSPISGKVLNPAAKRILDLVVGEKSVLFELLATLRGRRVGDLCSGLERRLFVAQVHDVDIQRRANAGLDVTARTFLPEHLLRDCEAFVVDNLRTHAFGDASAGAGLRRRIEVRVEEIRGKEGEPMARVIIRNNGVALDRPREISERARTLDTQLRAFGGSLCPPCPVREEQWACEYGYEVELHWNKEGGVNEGIPAR